VSIRAFMRFVLQTRRPLQSFTKPLHLSLNYV
jgi:hypothetical protein